MYRRTHLAAIADLGLEAGVAYHDVAADAALDLLELVVDSDGFLGVKELDVQDQLSKTCELSR